MDQISTEFNSVAARAGVRDSLEAARTYLRHEAGALYSESHVDAYLDAGPRMIDFLERETELRFAAAPTFPDYHSEAPGAATGRSIVAESCDADILGSKLQLLRPPLAQTTLFGMNVRSGTELNHFFRATRSLESAFFVVRRMTRHLFDLLRHGRGTRLANGNALVARLLLSAFDAGVDIRTQSPVHDLVVEEGRVVGAIVGAEASRTVVRARAGVLLACGGFSQGEALRCEFFPHARTGREHASPVPEGNVGDGLRLGCAVGGVLATELPEAAAWMPVSQVPRLRGRQAAFPHVVDRAKPGMIAVTRHDVRFANESNSYHDFGRTMSATSRGEPPSVFLVCDRLSLRRYGLGFVKPFPFPVEPHVRSGYLLKGRTVAELARAAGIAPDAMELTIHEYNEGARVARDPRFGRGSTRYNRFQGDAMHEPNPCVAPLEHGPFYAVRVVMGNIGTFAGLRADARARVLDADERPILGLYVAGNDMCSIVGGNYPGAGINIGPALTFGYIAALTAASDMKSAGAPVL